VVAEDGAGFVISHDEDGLTVFLSEDEDDEGAVAFLGEEDAGQLIDVLIAAHRCRWPPRGGAGAER
jgi:hypothetical protein